MTFQSIGEIASKIVGDLREERVWDGSTITEPGVYCHLPMKVYHSDCCDGPSLSSSGLRQLMPPNGCPLKFWDQSYLNPDGQPDDDKSHYRIGRAVHTLLLSEGDFSKEYAVRPVEFNDWRTKDAKAWRKKQIAAGKTVLVPDDLVNIQGMAERVARDQTFRDLLVGKIERSVIWKDERSGVWLKSRPDSIPADGFVADLKTTSDASDRGCVRAILDHGYHVQLALAVTGLEHLMKQQITDHVLLFIETKRPWAYNIKPVDNQLIHHGMRQVRAAIDTFADCWSTGEWPTYFGSGISAVSPDWFDKQIEREPSIPEAA